MKRLVKMSRRNFLVQRTVSVVCALALLATMLTCASFVSTGHVSYAQQQVVTKRPLTHQDYDSWRSIQAPQISRDGTFIAYAFLPQDG
ncbi:MAG TPA: hypothetical protein VEW46_07650, partial [Pyrinomonadaceae bacterium]|nr:hypothetical protein [Pyrinomonadaceae bacterium]